jgi:hypothetical protein
LPENAIDVRGVLTGHEFVKDWLKYTEVFEYPESFAVFSLLAMTSCAVDRRVLINPGSKPETHTNSFVLLYGPSGSRKSEAVMDALSLLGEAIPDAPVFPMNFTMEALRGRMAKESDDDGKTSGLILSEELSTLLGGREYLLNNSLFLGKVWDCRPRETFLTVAHDEQIIRHPYTTLGACTTPEAFGGLDPKALDAGFLRRISIVQEYGPKGESPLPPMNTAFFNNVLVPRFRERFATAALPTKGVLMRLSTEARELNETWYKTELREMRTEYAGPKENKFVNSLQVHAFKLGALLHLLDGHDPKELSARSLEYGLEMAKALLPGTFEAYNALVPSAFARTCMVIRRIVAAGPISMGSLDAKVKAEIGATPEQATAARQSLLNDGILEKAGVGRVKVSR